MLAAVLVDVSCDWPEVVFVGDIDEARRVAMSLPDDIGVSVQAVASVDDATFSGDRATLVAAVHDQKGLVS